MLRVGVAVDDLARKMAVQVKVARPRATCLGLLLPLPQL